jgi:ATP-dependent helicase/DNAse subunit B
MVFSLQYIKLSDNQVRLIPKEVSMKYMKRAQIYKSDNVTFNPATCEAHSYTWWKFVAKVDGFVIFNNYRYSYSTSKHQAKVRSLLDTLNIKVDVYAPFPQGIQGQDLSLIFEEAEENLCNQFLNEESKRITRNEKAKQRRDKLKVLEVERLTNMLGHTADCTEIYAKMDALTSKVEA